MSKLSQYLERCRETIALTVCLFIQILLVAPVKAAIQVDVSAVSSLTCVSYWKSRLVYLPLIVN